MKTRGIVLTAVLLALCVVVQSLKGLSVYAAGSSVNMILIITTLSVGLSGGLVIAVATPIIAYFLGLTPIMQLIPLMVFVVMLGNATIVLFAYLGRSRALIPCLMAGSVLKAVVLWILVWYAVLPIFGTAVPEAMQTAVRISFSVTQLVTALTGSAIAYVIYGRVKRLLPI